MKGYFDRYYHFTSSYYFAEGLRIASATIIPILIFSSFGLITTGIAFAIGALFTSLSDIPGPSDQRRAGVLLTIVLTFIFTTLVGISQVVPWLLAIELLVFTFFFAMWGIYSARAGTIGLVVMFVMVIALGHHAGAEQSLINATMGLLGGCWYFLWSIFLYSTNPFRLMHQSTGDYISSMAAYLKLNANFYNAELNDPKMYKMLFNNQSQIYTKQILSRELLYRKFNSVHAVNDKAKIALVGFVETKRLFAKIVAAQREYRILYEGYSPEARKKFRDTFLLMADEMYQIGIEIQGRKDAGSMAEITARLEKLEQYYNQIDPIKSYISSYENPDQSKLGLNDSINVHNYVAVRPDYEDPEVMRELKGKLNDDYHESIVDQKPAVQLFLENLNFSSDYFRHALRLVLAVLLGYIVSLYFPSDRSYWILITVLAILKPTYHLSKGRNLQRLTGTLTGAVVAIAILIVLKNSIALIAIIILCMTAAYSLMRIRYFFSSFFITVYIVIGLHLLNPGDLSTIAIDRIVDTLTGSSIAFIAVLSIPLIGERGRTKMILKSVIDANRKYIGAISFSDEQRIIIDNNYEILKKETSKALDSLNDAFQRLQYASNSRQEKLIIVYRCITAHNLLFAHTNMLITRLLKNTVAENVHHKETLLREAKHHLLTASRLIDEDLMQKNAGTIIEGTIPGKKMKEQKIITGIEPVSDNHEMQYRYIVRISKYIEKLTRDLLS
ncbi:FUSC family protein [Pollutibacter soli]|uniref:FUSC family protein n=1 Tax=Pollutibacter soli TaxID=3034157 RepID=UPI003013431B